MKCIVDVETVYAMYATGRYSIADIEDRLKSRFNLLRWMFCSWRVFLEALRCERA